MSVFRILLFLILVFSLKAWTCGHNLGEIQTGQKYLAIEFSDYKTGKKSYAMDDNGMLVLALVAASCNQDIKSPEVKISEEQKKCASETQLKAQVGFDDEIRDYYPPKKNSKVEKANNLIKENCGFDFLKIWKTTLDEFNLQELKCAPKAKEIAAKAAKQNKAYGEFMIRNAFIDQARFAEIKELEDKYKASHEFAEDLSNILNSDQPTVGQLKKWIEKSEKAFENHAYQVIDNPTDEFNPHKHESLIGILTKFKAKLPYVTGSRCGPGFPRDMLDKLANASWAPRADYFVPKNKAAPSEEGGQL